MSTMDKNQAEGKVILQASGHAEARNGPFHEVSAPHVQYNIYAHAYICSVVNVTTKASGAS